MPSAEVASRVVEVADALYALEPGGFTAARDAAVREERADRALAARLKKLKRPSLAAWAVNVLVRRQGEQIAQVLALGESLRAAAASLDGEELRALTRQRRQLTAALTSTARSLAREHGQRLTPAVSDQVEGVLNAALLDPVAAEVVQTGLLVAAFTSTGISELDVDAVCAVPEAVGSWTAREMAPPPAPAEAEAPQLTVVPDTAVRLEVARERLEETAEAVEQAQAAVGEAASALERLHARELQLGEEIDELQRRISALEEEREQVDEDLEDAETARDEATAELERAGGEHAEAQAEVDRLERRAAGER